MQGKKNRTKTHGDLKEFFVLYHLETMKNYRENKLIIFVNHLIPYKVQEFHQVMDYPIILNLNFVYLFFFQLNLINYLNFVNEIIFQFHMVNSE
jgi:hypothetical protein